MAYDPTANGFLPRQDRTFQRKYVWQWPIRVFHWLNALCIMVLFTTGLYIAFPQLSTAGEPADNNLMAYVRLVHFAAGYVFLVNFLWRIYWFWMGNNYARSGFPFVWRPAWWRDLIRQAWDYLKLERGHVHIGHNALGGLAYTVFVIGLGWAQIATGFALYSQTNPDGFWARTLGWLLPALGGPYQVHMWHHLFSWLFLVFAIIHVYIVVYDGQMFRNGLISSMINGFKFYREEDVDHDDWIS